MFKCLKCGMEGGYPEEPTAACPYCKSLDIDEVFHCIRCGEYFVDDDMIGSICVACVKKRATKANAYAYAMRCGDDPATIDGMTDQEVRVYCLDDKYDFSEFLEGEDD